MSSAVAERITVAGVYDIPADVYHADPVEGGSLSSTGARTLASSAAFWAMRVVMAWATSTWNAPRPAVIAPGAESCRR